MAPTWFDLHGRVALVTGGSKGLGRVMAVALARAGADVAVASRTQSDLDVVAAELRRFGVRALAVAADVTSEASVAAMVRRVLAEFGRVDILVNNAGVGSTVAVTEMDPAYWDSVMSINVRAPMLCCKHVGPHMFERRSGKVINVASVMSTRVARYMSAYCASKAALLHFTRTLALEWVRHGIQVNALCPGYFLTDMNREFFASERGKAFAADLPAGRLGRGEELEGAVVFLASEASSYVTGSALYIDGGHSLA